MAPDDWDPEEYRQLLQWIHLLGLDEDHFRRWCRAEGVSDAMAAAIIEDVAHGRDCGGPGSG